jgi:hypothetical protein
MEERNLQAQVVLGKDLSKWTNLKKQTTKETHQTPSTATENWTRELRRFPMSNSDSLHQEHPSSIIATHRCLPLSAQTSSHPLAKASAQNKSYSPKKLLAGSNCPNPTLHGANVVGDCVRLPNCLSDLLSASPSTRRSTQG